MQRRMFLAATGAAGLAAAFSLPRLAHANDDVSEVDLTQKGFTRRMLETPVGTMAVHEIGAGEPLLLLHGVGAGASSFIWYRIAPKLAERYRVIAPDFVGWGASERLTRDVVFEDYVTQIGVLAREIGRPVRTIADSLTCGFTIAAIEQGLLETARLVLMSPSGGLDFGIDATPPQALAQFRQVLSSPRREEIYANIFHRRPAVEDWYRFIGFAESDAVPEELIRSNLYYARRPNASYSALPFLAGLIRFDVAPFLQKVPDPTLMIWGEGEIQIPPAARERIEQANPDIRAVRVQNARSVFAVEQPEATLDLLLPFLA